MLVCRKPEGCYEQAAKTSPENEHALSELL